MNLSDLPKTNTTIQYGVLTSGGESIFPWVIADRATLYAICVGGTALKRTLVETIEKLEEAP